MKKYTWLFLFLMVAVFATAGCGSSSDSPADNPSTDGDSDVVETVDGDQEVIETVDGDLDHDVRDTDEGPLDCTGDKCACDASNLCPKDYACHPIGVCRKAECEKNEDCQKPEPRNATWTCDTAKGGFCVQKACKSSDDCIPGQSCEGGVCEIRIPTTDLKKIVINEGSGLIAQTKTRTLTATGYTANGMVVPGLTITWASDKADAVAVDAATGVLTGGATSGEAKITAKVDTITSDAVSYINFATVSTGARVVVFDQADGKLLKDVDVYLIAAAARKADPIVAVKTDVNGTATFAAPLDCSTNGCAVHVQHADYTFVSAFGVKSNDIMVPVTKNTSNTIADGVKGHQKADSVPVGLRGDVRLGLTMFSIPGNLADLNFTSLIGDMITTDVEVGSLKATTPLPSALEGYLNETEPLKDGYYTVGMPGKATLWGLGGYAVLGDLIDQVSTMIGDTIDVPGILGVVLPLFNDFYHGVQTGFELKAVDKVVDVNDRNKDGSKTDLVADIDKFSTVDLKVTQKQTYDVAINYPIALPTLDGTACADAAITLIGAMQKGVGFVPLGIAAALDKKNNKDAGNCKLGAADDGKATSKYAPQHGSLSGNEYYTLNVAIPLSKLMAKNSDGKIDISGSVTRSAKAYDNDKNPINVPAFLNFMTDAKVTVAATHVKVEAKAIDGAAFHRLVLSKNSDDKKTTKYWHIYWGTTAPDFDTLGTDNRAVGFGGASMAQAISLNDATYADMFSFGDKNITKMNDLLKSFSMHILDAPK